MKTRWKIFLNILAVAALLLAGFFFRQQVINLVKFRSIYAPCEQPITYSLGVFDSRFGLSEKSFLQAVAEAEAIWEQEVGRNFFTQTQTGGQLEINLIYDYRQQTTVELNTLGEVVEENRASYDKLVAYHKNLNQDYLATKEKYDLLVMAFEKRQAVYDQEVKKWNKQGGAPKPEHERLQAEQKELEAELAYIRELEVGLREDVAELNALAKSLNRLAATLNLKVAEYNQIGDSRGEEFTEGDYQTSFGKKVINIYEFGDQDKLVRLLAHEFGHALGLEHVADPKAIMYRLNNSTNDKLTADDVEALKARCQILND